uniref:Neuropeptide GPCR A37 n=1 Tax=Nilaparvata lugens TaxID=108931 RepID=U3U8Z7_NILLU|nr:neuropeptide GPCR A37 [Nilaparvata lugens]
MVIVVSCFCGSRARPVDVWGPRRDPLLVVVPMTTLYVTILVCGVVGNVSTCVVIARNKHMHTATNYYLFSLAISDLLLLLAGLPTEIYHLWFLYPYVFGEAVCVLTGLAAETSANATVLTITAFTVERYVAICHPFLSHAVSKLSRAVKYVVIIWMLALLLAVPQALQLGIVYEVYRNGTKVSEDLKLCTIKHAVGSHTFGLSSVLFFLAPMLLISVLYALIGLRLQRSNRAARREAHGGGSRPLTHTASRRHHAHAGSTRRVVKMLVAVVVAFFICWAPFQAQRLYAVYGYEGDKTSAQRVILYKTMTYLSGLLYYLSTTVNPILYNIMSLKFRQAFKSTLTKCCSPSSGKDLQSLGVEVCGSGSGGAAVGVAGSGGGGRLQYAVLSRRSSRNNSAASSVNSAAGEADLTRRPLVVSFRRRSARTSSTSLDCASSPEQKRLQPSAPPLALVDLPPVHRSLPLHSITDNCTWTQAPPSRHLPDKVPCIEDIEIFQESQLKIRRSSKKIRLEPESHSQPDTVADAGDKCGNGKPPSASQVAKSQTLPCILSNINDTM